MNEIHHARLIKQLRELILAFKSHRLNMAAIGGIAVNVHGYNRATHDLDFLIALEDEPRVQTLMHALGYIDLDRREDLSSYIRGNERVDYVHAHRPISRKLLAQAQPVGFADTELSVISAEGLIGLKIQAFNDDPRRLKDLLDMIELMKIRGASLNIAELRDYFRLFNRESLLEDLLKSTHTPGS